MYMYFVISVQFTCTFICTYTCTYDIPVDEIYCQTHGIDTLIIPVGKEHLKLIFEYAEWVLKEHQEDGLKVCVLNKEGKIT